MPWGQLSLCAPSESHVPQLLSPHAVEPVHGPTAETPMHCNEDPAQHKQNKACGYQEFLKCAHALVAYIIISIR